jgi:hypothetical protein
MSHLARAFLPVFLLPNPLRSAVLDGYAWPPSVAQGDTLGLYVSCDAPAFDIEIVREGAATVSYLVIPGLPGVLQAVPDSAWLGAGWSQTCAVAIPPEWPSGVYYARLLAPGISVRHAVFVVREDAPGSTARILLQNSFATWHAYDAWGGKCLYDTLSTDGQRAHAVSFLRPYSRNQGRGLFPMWEQLIVRWLESQGYAVEYCIDWDTAQDPTLHSSYDLLLIAGHDEYWSYAQRATVEARLAAGGNLAIFGGNCCWWQVRYSPGMDQVVCYKDAALDPLRGVADSLVTVHWRDPPVNRPENPMTGPSLANGGGPTGSGGYVVERADHWLFEGTGVSNGEEFGTAQQVVGVEVDGALFQRIAGVPVPTGVDGTPLSFEIVATAPATLGNATMGVFDEGAQVFNAASINWASGVASDSVTQRVCENVLGRLVSGNPFLADSGDVSLEDVTWSSPGSTVSFTLTFRNTNPQARSRGVYGRLHAHFFGDFPSPGPSLSSFALSSIPPSQTATVTLNVPVSSLPPSAARLLPGGAPSLPGCVSGSTWIGGASVRWRETGVSDTTVSSCSRSALSVCPASGPSHVQVSVGCADPAGVSWTVTPLPPEWNASLVQDSGGTPGLPAPNPLPPGPFAGWISVEAASSVPAGATADVAMVLGCGSESARVIVTATACWCQDPTDVVSTVEGTHLALHPVYPSPSWSPVIIGYDLPAGAAVRLSVHDVLGRRVRVLFDGFRDAGSHSARWDGTGVGGVPAARGIYFVRLESCGEALVQRVVRSR